MQHKMLKMNFVKLGHVGSIFVIWVLFPKLEKIHFKKSATAFPNVTHFVQYTYYLTLRSHKLVQAYSQ